MRSPATSEANGDHAVPECGPDFMSGLGTGVPLDSASRRYFEPRFGHDFGAVRLHDGARANSTAASLSARAFTIGNDVVFAAGEYLPASPSGRRLIAHELAHVAQNQRQGPVTQADPGPPATEPSSSIAEAEAHRASRRVVVGFPAGPLTARNAGIALTPTSDQVIPLLSYSLTDLAVTDADEREVLRLLRADANLPATITDINGAGMLDELLERVDEPANKRDLLRLLGARLNPATRAIVEPLIQDLDINRGAIEGAQIQYSLGRLGVSGAGAAFYASSYSDLISSNTMGAFTGVGATGVNPMQRGYTDWLGGAGTSAFDDHINPVGDLGAYLNTLTADQRRRQVELLVGQPISTNFAESYADQLPSRLQVIRAAANANTIEPELVTAIILAEQRDQSLVEDARDFIGAFVLARNTSMGLGQVVPATARRHDLFSSLLTNETSPMAASTARRNVNPSAMVWLLTSDEVNITAVARYIRILANDGATRNIATLPNTQAEFPGINLAAYANPSSTWPIDNVGAIGMYYTSRAWTDDTRSSAWGWFVQEAYRDVKAAAVF